MGIPETPAADCSAGSGSMCNEESRRTFMNTTEGADNAHEIRDGAAASRNLAAAEKKAARRMDLAGYLWWLVAALLLFISYLVTPHAGSVLGYEVVFRLPSAIEANIKVTEYIFAWLSALGIGVFTTLTLITRRTSFGLIAWMLSTVALLFSLLAVWLRQTRDVSEEELGAGFGLYLAILGVVVAVYAYSRVALRRSPEQAELAEARARDDNLDEVGYAQREVQRQQQASFESNPILIDDRRQRATERYLASNPEADPGQLGQRPDREHPQGRTPPSRAD